MRRNPSPSAFYCSAVTITAVVSARRGATAAGSTMWVDPTASAADPAGAHRDRTGE